MVGEVVLKVVLPVHYAEHDVDCFYLVVKVARELVRVRKNLLCVDQELVWLDMYSQISVAMHKLGIGIECEDVGSYFWSR